MLAPRKTLWSTPDAVVKRVVEIASVNGHDCVVDVGCGDVSYLHKSLTFRFSHLLLLKCAGEGHLSLGSASFE